MKTGTKKPLFLFADDPETERIRLEEIRAMPIWRKFQLVNELTMEYREHVQSKLKRRYQQASEQEIKMRMAVEFLGQKVVKEVYGWEAYDE